MCMCVYISIYEIYDMYIYIHNLYDDLYDGVYIYIICIYTRERERKIEIEIDR
jgi:hypothetical protein